MKPSSTGVGTMLVAGLLFSAGPARAGEAIGPGASTAEGKQVVASRDVKITALAEWCAELMGNYLSSCYFGTVKVDDMEAVTCFSFAPHENHTFEVKARWLKETPFDILYDEQAISPGLLVYKPLVPAEGKTVDDFRKAGAVVDDSEMREALLRVMLGQARSKASRIAEEKAVEDFKNRMGPSGPQFDSGQKTSGAVR